MIIYVCNTDHGGRENQNGASSNGPDDYVRKSDLHALYLNISSDMEKKTRHLTGAIERLEDEMKLLREQYQLLNTKYVKLLERICGEGYSIGEREREFNQLLKEKEALQRKLESSNVHKEEIEEELKKEKIRNKELYNENEPLKKEIDELKMENTRLEKKIETLLATENRYGIPEEQDQEIQNMQTTVIKVNRFIKELTLRNQKILELEREIRYLENRLGIPRRDSYFALR